jgi:hypothetical protein
MNAERPGDSGEPLRTPPGLSPIHVVAALDRAWQAIRVRHKDVPPVVLLPGPGPTRPGAKRRTRGHFLSFAWSLRDLPTRASLPDGRQAADPGGEGVGPDGHATPEAILRELYDFATSPSASGRRCSLPPSCSQTGQRTSSAYCFHETAHAIAAARGTKETSRQGRYHNGRFKLIAEEVGSLAEGDGAHSNDVLLTPARRS